MTAPIRFAGIIPTAALEKAPVAAEAQPLIDRTSPEYMLKKLARFIAVGTPAELLSELYDCSGMLFKLDARRRAVVIGDAFDALRARPTMSWSSQAMRTMFQTAQWECLGALPLVNALAFDLLVARVGDGDKLVPAAVEMMHALARNHIHDTYQVDPARADDLEVTAHASSPEFQTGRDKPWEVRPDGARPHPIPLTEAFFQRILPLKAGPERATLLNMADMDWLTRDQQDHEIDAADMADERVAGFAGAAPYQVSNLIRRAMRGENAYSVLSVPNLAVGASHAIAQGLFSQPPMDATDADVNLNHRLTVLKQVASAYPKPVSTGLMNQVAHAAARQLVDARVPDDVRVRLEQGVVPLVVMLAARGDCLAAASSDEICKMLASLDLQSLSRSTPRGQAYHTDNSLRIALSREGASRSDSTRIRSAVLASGLVGLEGIRASDLREAIIGEALKRRPERLAEITDLDTFLDVARRLRIPVELPDTVKESIRMAASMNAVIDKASMVSSNDVLAEVAEAPKKSRRARA
jgi:hypothetical protein